MDINKEEQHSFRDRHTATGLLEEEPNAAENPIETTEAPDQLGHNSNHLRCPQSETTETDNASKKVATAKLKIKKQKQRLSSMCYKHQDVAFGKEVTSTNKVRIMKLSIELEKQINNQMKDYNSIECVLKELLKILEQKRQNDPHSKRENDLHLFRQSKCIPSIMDFCNKLFSLYKNQFKESFRLLEIMNKILQQFCIVGCNRQYMIVTNRVPTLTSLLTNLIKKEETSDPHFLSNLYSLITSLLDSKLQGDYGCLIQQTVEYIHQCTIIKKTISLLESLVEDGSLISEHLVKSSLKFIATVLSRTDHLVQQRPIDELSSNPASPNCVSNVQLLIVFLNEYIQIVIPDKDTRQRSLLQGDLPVSTVSTLLLIVQVTYLCCKLSLASVQKLISDQFLCMISFVLRYSKEFCEQSEDLRQLLNRGIVLIGYLGFDSQQMQSKINQSHIISDLCNLPTKFVVDKKSIEVLIPTLCSLVFDNQKNMDSVFQDLSAVYVKKFLKNEIHLHSNQQKSIGSTPGLLTRKSSLSSMTSANTQCSGIMPHDKDNSIFALKTRFPIKYWKTLYNTLDPFE